MVLLAVASTDVSAAVDVLRADWQATATEADILTTALLVLGPEERVPIVQRYGVQLAGFSAP